MKVLVTGAAGFIGSQLLRQLAAHPNVETSALVRSSTNLWRLRTSGLSQEGGRLRLIEADLCDDLAVELALRGFRPDVLIHLAMAYHILGSPGGKDVDAVNLDATLRLQRTFLDCGGRRFITAGTSFEYGCHDLELLTESTPCRPIYDYAIAKARAAEGLLNQGRRSGTEALVLRVFAPYGPLEGRHRFVPQLLATALQRQRLELSPGEQVRDYVYVEDVAAAFVAAALYPALPVPQAVYNVCSGVGYTLRELSAVAAQVLGGPLDLHWGKLPYRPHEMMRLVGDNRRIRLDLGWRPSCPLRDGLARTARWMTSSAGPESRAA